MIMLKFFFKHGLKLDEVFRICTGMRNAVIHTILDNGITHSDEKFMIVVELFDTNFAGVIREYTEIHHGAGNVKEPTSCHLSMPAAESVVLKNNNKPTIDNSLLDEYFSIDADEADKVLFRTDDVDDLLEYFHEISERLSLAALNTDFTEIEKVANTFSKISSILLHYTPYLDSLAASMSEMSIALIEHSEVFMEAIKNTNDGMLKLFDAVSIDMDSYIERFSLESLAMKNSHHIHEPTTFSVRQIIVMFAPDQIAEGEMEFF